MPYELTCPVCEKKIPCFGCFINRIPKHHSENTGRFCEGSKQGTKGSMPEMRWLQIMNNDAAVLTQEEMEAGWHFCPEFDELLVGPGMEEFGTVCQCAKASQK